MNRLETIRLRVWLWLTRPLPCKLGRHVSREGYCSYGFGEMTLHCTRCEKGIISIPFEDMTPEQQSWVRDTTEYVMERLEEETA